MKTLAAKITFESTEDFKVTIRMEGTRAGLIAAVYSIVWQLAKSEGIPTEEVLQKLLFCEQQFTKGSEKDSRAEAETRERFEKFLNNLFRSEEK